MNVFERFVYLSSTFNFLKSQIITLHIIVICIWSVFDLYSFIYKLKELLQKIIEREKIGINEGIKPTLEPQALWL